MLSASGGLRSGLEQARGHLEANLAAASALQSPYEYKRWLSTYASYLAGEALMTTSKLLKALGAEAAFVVHAHELTGVNLAMLQLMRCPCDKLTSSSKHVDLCLVYLDDVCSSHARTV